MDKVENPRVLEEANINITIGILNQCISLIELDNGFGSTELGQTVCRMLSRAADYICSNH